MTRSNVMLVFGAIAIAGLSFAVGESLGQRAMLKALRINLDDVQAMLLVDRVVSERKLKSLLAHDCAIEAMTTVDHNETLI
jgi:hypothetical protein